MFTISPKRSVAALALAAGLLAAAAPANANAHAPAPAALGMSPQGLIMKDGNVCNPIRHIGC
jgi:hypothetical protein